MSKYRSNCFNVIVGGPDYVIISLAIFQIIFAGTTNTYATSAWCLAFIACDPNLVRDAHLFLDLHLLTWSIEG